MDRKTRRILKKLSRICLCAGCLTAPAAYASAETITWNGSDSAWNTASNWLINGAVSTRTPASSDTIIIPSGKSTVSGDFQISGGSLDLAGGSATFNNRLYIAAASGSGGSVTVRDGSTLELKGADTYIGSGGSNAVLNQTGGTVIQNSWFNIGEGSEGTYNISGGTLNSNGMYFCVGRRAKGTLNISGTADVNLKNLYVGYFAHLSKDSLVMMTGGTLDAESLYISANPDNAGSTPTHATTVTVNGGTAAFSNKAYVGFDGRNSTGGNGVLNVGGNGTVTFNAESYVGYNPKGKGALNVSGNGVFTANAKVYLSVYGGTSEMNVTGGTANFKKDIGIAHGDNARSAVNVSDGAVTISGKSFLGDGENSVADIHVSGGSLRFNSVVYGGYKNGAQTTINITGGTLYGPNADFLVGDHSGAVTKLIVDGGTYNQNGKGNLVIRSTTANGDIGNLVQLKSGTLDTLWLSLGQNGVNGGVCTFDMTGGTLKIGNGDNQFRIGLKYNAVANISGGTVNVKGETLLANSANGGTLNIYGSDAVFSTSTMTAQANGNLNYISDGITLNADGSAQPAFTNISVSGTSNIKSTVRIDTSDYSSDGILLANDLATTQTIMTAGTLNWTPKTVETEGIWNIQQNGQKIEMILDENHLAEAVVSGNDAFASGNFDEEGWIKITGGANEVFSLTVGLDGEGDVDELVAWLELQSEEAGQNVKVTDAGGALTFSDLMLDADGVVYMNYDLTAFNLQNGASFALSNVPEPSAWILLSLGVFGMLGIRRKKSRKAETV